MKKTFTTKNIVLIAMFSALALVLHLFDFSIPVIAPEFYKFIYNGTIGRRVY